MRRQPISTSSERRNPVEALAEQFLARKRAGEQATPEEYAEAHPELAEEILAVFPGLLMLEDLAGDSGDRTGSVATGAGTTAGASAGRLGEFRLLRELGRGGMGVVYEAEQESLCRRVAVKVLPAGALTDSRMVQRFEREARSAARLHHTHIVPVFGVGQHEGTHFYVMQLIQGQGLDSVLRELRGLRDARAAGPGRSPSGAGADRQPAAVEIAISLATGRFAAGFDNKDALSATATLPWSEPSPRLLHPSRPSPAVSGLSSISGATNGTTLNESDRRFAQGVARLGVQVAEALAHAHGQGILHRDIKPSNLLLDRDGNVWVADFGLAKAVGSDDLTHTGDVVGTLRYMAPERFDGEGDARADIYALGLTLYELLALRAAYPEPDRTKLIRQVTQEEPPPLRRLNRRVPADLETIVHKAMAREPGRRYQTAKALGEDLRRFLEGRPIRARQVSAAERAWRWCQRNRAVAALIGGIALALLAGTGGSVYFAVAAQGNADRAMAHAHRADEEAIRARDEKLLGDRRLYVAEANLAQQAWRDGLIDLVHERLRAHVPKAPRDPDLRGFEWSYLDRLCQSELRTFRGHADNVMGLAFSPDGRRIVSASEDGTLKLWETATGHEIRTFRSDHSHVLDVAFSPDGRTFASAGMDWTVQVWDADTGRKVSTLRGHTGWVLDVAFSPDGSRIASAGGDHTVKLWDSQTGQVILTLRGHSDSVWGVDFSPDGRRLASAGADAQMKVWNLASAEALLTLHGHSGPIWDVAFSPDGGSLASVGHDRTVKLWHAGTGKEIQTFRGHSARVLGVTFSRDGRTLASASEDRTVKLWDVATGRDLLTLRGHEAPVWGVAFSPDGRTIASAANDRTIRLWETNPRQEFTPLRGHLDGVSCTAFSPDGRTLASGGEDCTLRVWDADTGQEIQTLRGHTSTVMGLAYSPDGRTLASAGADRTVKLWDTETGGEIKTLRGHSGFVSGVAFSPDGLTLATASEDRTVRLWDAESGHVRLTLRGHSGGSGGDVAFSPDGRRVAAAGSDPIVRVWDAASGQEVLTLRGHSGGVGSVAFSPDGRFLATAGGDGTARLWDANTGGARLVLRGHSGGIGSVAFSPDGRRLASAGDDATVRLWDVATGQGVLTLRGHSGGVACVTFRPDGLQIASAGSDGTLALWDAMPMTTQRQELHEGMGVVEFLFEKPLPITEVLARIRQDPTLSEPVRRHALALAEPYGRSRLEHEAEQAVHLLVLQALLRPEMRESLRTDPTLSEPVRRRALVLAEVVALDNWMLNAASWDVVRHPGAPAAVVHRALRQAEAACRNAPDSARCFTTLGVARYRLGNYQEAIAALEQADRIDAAAQNHLNPARLAFLALAHHRLGRTEETRAALSLLRVSMKRPEWAESGEALSYLHEAEGIEQDLAFPADPIAH